MSQANHYRSNLRDIHFNLFEVLDVGNRVLGKQPFEAMTEDTAREALRSLDKLAGEVLAQSFASTDRDPPRLEDGEVRLPQGLEEGMKAYFEEGWHRLDLPEGMGGFGAPPSLAWAASELTIAANPALGFYTMATFMSRVIDRLGTDAQKRRFLPQMIDRNWLCAMVLTEPDAGSDVGAARAKATHVSGDEWHLEGVKRFITNGEVEGAENIVHFVLARPEGGAAGTKGLSMFIVPKYWVEEDGSLGARNGMRCTGLEKKMGLKGSATCEMTYGDGEPCRGLLVGESHEGIRQMFHIIEQARMLIGVKSMATLSSAYAHALEFSKERVQGPDLALAADKSSPRVRIIQHPDVRRMLMEQKAHAQGMRALLMFAASLQDQVEQLGGHGNAEANEVDRLNDLLLPLLKGYCSEKVSELLKVSLQCFGGSGYLQDYPIEQYLRDQKIDSLYEGTTHIQALDLLFRKVARDGGETLRGLLGRVGQTIATKEGGDALAKERALLAESVGELEKLFGALLEKLGDSVYHAGLQGNRVLYALAEVVIGWLLIRHAAIAEAKLAEAKGEDRAFYEGKIASARWFARNVLPSTALTRRLVEESSLELMELSEEAF